MTMLPTDNYTSRDALEKGGTLVASRQRLGFDEQQMTCTVTDEVWSLEMPGETLYFMGEQYSGPPPVKTHATRCHKIDEARMKELTARW